MVHTRELIMGRDVAVSGHTIVPHCAMGCRELSLTQEKKPIWYLTSQLWMAVCHYCQLLWLRGKNEGGGAKKKHQSDSILVLRSSYDVMFKWHTQHPHPPLPLLSVCFVYSPPFFSWAQYSILPLVNSTIEILRISTNQGSGAPSHRFHSNRSQPPRTPLWMCNSCVWVHVCTVCIGKTNGVKTLKKAKSFSEFIHQQSCRTTDLTQHLHDNSCWRPKLDLSSFENLSRKVSSAFFLPNGVILSTYTKRFLKTAAAMDYFAL